MKCNDMIKKVAYNILWTRKIKWPYWIYIRFSNKSIYNRI